MKTPLLLHSNRWLIAIGMFLCQSTFAQIIPTPTNPVATIDDYNQVYLSFNFDATGLFSTPANGQKLWFEVSIDNGTEIIISRTSDYLFATPNNLYAFSKVLAYGSSYEFKVKAYFKVSEFADVRESTTFSSPSNTVAASKPRGITIITHGFSVWGTLNASWKSNAQAIRRRLSTEHGIGKGATVLINSLTTGHWQYLEDNVNSNGSLNSNEEIIFLYDWAALSNDPLLGNQTGYLEAAADILYAMLINPVIEGPNGESDKIGGTSPGALLAEKNTHFIGHSRGGILLLQLLYRLKANFPNIDVERLTLLDPHPAGTFGDVERADISGSPKNLPGVYGAATTCFPLFCLDGGQSVYLTVPDNVIKVENFYRQGAAYEPALEPGQLSPFMGVPLIGGNNSYLMNNGIMTNGSDYLGGAHSAVPTWYFKTVDLLQELTTNQADWFSIALGNFMTGLDRTTAGYNIFTLPEVPIKATLTEYNQAYQKRTGKPSVEKLFNGDFGYGNASGWRYSYFNNQKPTVVNGELLLYPQLDIDYLSHTISARHNMMHFPLSSTSISLDVKRSSSSYSGTINPLLSIEFYDIDNQKIYATARAVSSTEFETFTFGIPPGLRGKNGTIQLVFANNGANSDFNQSHLRLVVDNVKFGETTQTVAPPTISASKTTISGGQSVLLTATGCENGTVYWTNQQSGTSISVTPLETSSYSAFCAIDGFYSAPSNVVTVTVNYSHSLASGEYFFDSDPGYSNGFSLPLTGTPSVLNQTFNIGLSAHNLSQGIHTLGIRLKDDKGDWSLTHTRPFLVQGFGSDASETITQVEYFYDSLKTDKSNLIAVNVSPDGFSDIALPLTINLSQGVHTISVRAKDNMGKYSLFHTRPFLVLGFGSGSSETITQVEYFYDSLKTDKSNLIAVNVNPDGFNNIALPLNVNLSQGVHTITVRAKDNTGKFSLFHTRPFLVLGFGSAPTAISKIEYFLDADPGFGNGTQVPYSASSNNVAQISLDLGSVSAGVHTVFVRVQDNGGRWSLTHVRPFVVMPNLGGSAGSIARIEYFINQPDPGQGQASSVSFSPVGGSDVTALFDANLAGLGNGTHRLYARAQDNAGSWSTLHSVAFDIVCAANGLYFTIKSGSWDDPTVWNCGTVPSAMEAVRISTDHTIALPANYTATAKTVELQGNLQYNANAKIQLGL